ncbi:MAG TPA: hypothetical protein VG435_11435 [Acidimicrobiales bacterium]|nr:hypothetical protein [Acidimicrobiales bacterium]
MNKIGSLIEQLHDAEVSLAADYRKVGERHAVEHDLWYGCHTVAQQCEGRAEQLRAVADRYGDKVAAPHDSEMLRSLMTHVRHAGSDLIGRSSSAGLLMLRDLRHLYTATEEVSFYWVLLGQVAQAKRDRRLIETVDILHRQVLDQIKWLKTRAKEASPQILVGR